MKLIPDTGPQPTPCGERRPHTNARCEKPVDHLEGNDPLWDLYHCGRDSYGRWHSWIAPVEPAATPLPAETFPGTGRRGRGGNLAPAGNTKGAA